MFFSYGADNDAGSRYFVIGDEVSRYSKSRFSFFIENMPSLKHEEP